MKLRHLVNQSLRVAFVIFGLNLLVGASVASASCGDYLDHSAGSVRPPHALAEELAAELPLLGLEDRPCDGPGCKQSLPKTSSELAAVASARSSTHHGLSPAMAAVCLPTSEWVGWKNTDWHLDSHCGSEILRPPASSPN